MGSFQCTTNDLKHDGKTFKFKNTKVQFAVMKTRVDEKYSFLDFLHSGMQMNFVVAIDYTGSNGDPSRPDSLHYNNPQVPNQYVQAIRAVGEIIEDYDTDKVISNIYVSEVLLLIGGQR